MDTERNLTDLTFARLLEEFAARTPTPGGGAAAGLVAALGAALGAMAFRFSRKKEELESPMEERAAGLQREASRFASAAEEDCRAYEEVRAAFRLPKDTEEEKSTRSAAIRKATIGALASPLGLMERILEAARILAAGAEGVKPALASDLASAAWCFRSGGEMAWLNVRINAASLPGDPEAEEALAKGKHLKEDLLEVLAGILAKAEEGL